ncbi:MAG: sigma-70 factor domain-containing protein, partial [Chloroflexota bacterium]
MPFEGHELSDDSVGTYLREIAQVPLLTAAEERVLSRQIEGARHVEKLEAAYLKKYQTEPSAVTITADLIARIVRD